MINPNASSRLGRHAEIMSAVYERINQIHKRPLHRGQIAIARDYFIHGKRIVMSQWSRNGGKTEGALFLSNVASLLNDKFQTMIICPELKQGKKIYWHKKRLQTYAPPKYIKDISATDLKIEFENGSIITVDGCENYEGLRGVKPDLVIYDEFQHHSKEFHLEVMEPNLLSKDKSLFVFGTPPKSRAAYYVEFRDQLIKKIKAEDPLCSYYEFDASINPVNDAELLRQKRKELIESGNEVIWLREYEGKLAFGGEDVVFPKWDPRVHVRTHRVVTSYLEHDRHKLRWFTICDPGTCTCFAVLFAAYNPHTQQVFILDEIYEKDRGRTDTRQIWERIRKKEEELYPGAPSRTWRRVYDEAAAWFCREVQANFKECLAPSRKQHTSEEDDISRIKMLMANSGSLTVSDRCYYLRWEIESYVTDNEGRFPDKNNHLIDCFKYLMQTSCWKLVEKGSESLSPEYSPVPNQPLDVDPTDWADVAVDKSLWVNPNDIYSEYFN